MELMSIAELKGVEDKLDQLIRLCHRLETDNATLRAREQGWEQERKRLMEKNEIARKRVEAMIRHLKNLETQS